MTSYANPRDHPDNANVPNVNLPRTIISLTVTFMLSAVFAISLRLWVRFRDRLWGWDDLFVLLAGVASVVGDTFVCLMPGDGLGLHLWTLSSTQLSDYFRHIYVTNAAYCISATFIKLAILFQFLRLFAETAASTSTAQYRLARRVTVGLITISSLWGFAFSMLALFPCQPINKEWHPRKPGKCIGWGSKDPDMFFPMFAGHSASNMVLDMFVLLLPIPFLGMLRLAGKSRAGLITLFSLGLIVCALSVGRLISLSVNRAGTIPIIDMPYHTPLIYVFSVLEVNVAIIAASIPIFWPVIANMATNKIWVVNEIEVRVENTVRGASFSTNGEIDLADQGPWTKLEDSKDDYGSKANRLSVITKTYERPASRTHHGHKPSTASSNGRTMGFETGPRASHESTRNLCRTPTTDRNLSVTQQNSKDWFAEMDRQNTAGSTTTDIRKTDVTPEQIRRMESR
ncbi:hypothetical protein HBI56_055710 [Parastagonospora nodorum]|uniref:Rhodopsin domain-containing protein n=1 Tax=Phaeosphaeria nodorum (strain SN15 / ATCC MYA-4574 / FGSC 10173) TaxID=321614 RepID=A0A7U2ICB8_PHANO|nr:hypothetical protein HBH56_096390 [Parastagonospora nodorum]QRD07237.1 hypothetical protein JI435_124360 [Parastagonospora nodorum SN15]KAH3930190.1 hypothetical protein HBH54_110710 [Parastagonospora nodorum]KAH3944969.1 hypothetical protein HBH53_148720 [Parastagonospora nodorum]KAH3966931.1 hypothetical protein HBH51_140120 [Parastagonospora nodorum]